MKTLKLSLILSVCITFILIACEKDNNDDATNPQPLTRTEILTQKVWQIDEVQRSVAGTNSEYLRGGVNSTGVPYQNIRIKFNADGTGTYTDENSVAHTLNWLFTSNDQRNATLNVGPPNAAVFNWKLIELKDNYMHCTAPYNSNSVYAARYIQVP